MQTKSVRGRGMSVLGEVAEFTKSVVELLRNNKAEAVAVVVLGSAAIGYLVGYAASWLRAKWRGGTGPKCDKRHVTPEEAATLARISEVLDALDKPNAELWQLTKPEVPHDLLNKIHQRNLRVLTFANLKGGVGKTTLAANVAAYFAKSDEDVGRRQGYRVLLIDFDYQGNLSSTFLQAARGTAVVYSQADKILRGGLEGRELVSPVHELGDRVPNVSLVPAGFELGRQENRLLFRHLLVQGETDPRYSLLRLLADDEVLNKFNLVVIDTPPRLTLGTIAGLCASTHVVIPTNLNGQAIANVGNLVEQLDRLFRKELNPRIEFSGIVGSMTNMRALGATEMAARKTVEEAAQSKWGARAGGNEAIALLDPMGAWPDDAYVFAQNIPDTAPFRKDAGRSISYLNTNATHSDERAYISELGRQIAKRIGL